MATALMLGCVGPLRYLTGEVHITTRIVPNASGGEVVHNSVRIVQATALSLETGVVYKDQTHEQTAVQSHGTWFDTGFIDGSHRVHIVSGIRLFAPGGEQPQLVVRVSAHLRRVAGSSATPPVDFERASFTCE